MYFRSLRYTNTNNANGKDYNQEDKYDDIYRFDDNMSCIAYYVNSVSFNNYVSL